MAESPYLRKHYIKADGLGIDPLKDMAYRAIIDVLEYSPYICTQNDVGNVQYIAWKQYRRTEAWWIILVYNGIANGRTIKLGQEIRLPSLSAVGSALNKLRSEDILRLPLDQRTVTI